MMLHITGKYFSIVLFWLMSCHVFADYPIEIVDLKHQTVQQMIPLVRPFLGSGDTVTGIRGQLIIKTAPENYSQILKIIDKFDQASKQLMIYVAQGNSVNASGDRAQANVNIGVGEHGRVIVGRPGHEGISASMNSQQRILEENITQRVRATEGMPAFIKTGVDLPIPVESRQGISRGSYRITYGHGEASTGFYVVPQILGQKVILQINPKRQKPGFGYSTQIQEVSTQVTGRVGEWIELGGSVTTAGSQQSSTLGRSSQQYSSHQPIRVLVQILSD